MTGVRISLLGVLLLVGAPVNRAAYPTPAGYVSDTLANGLRVSILPDPSAPLVATQLWYHVGAANEDERSRGLAHLFEHLMFGATSRYGEREYWELHHAHGGDNNAYTSPDETTYVSEIPAGPQHLQVLGMEAERMRGLLLTAAHLENEKRIVTEELRLRTENDPMSRLFVAAQRALLDGHPYAIDPNGAKEDVAAATLESCRRFYDRHYQPAGAHLIVVGPVDAAATLEAVRDLRPAAGGRR